MYTVDLPTAKAPRGFRTTLADNFRLVTGPEADQAIAAHLANGPALVMAPYRADRLPDTVIEGIWQSHRKGTAPGRIASTRSTDDHPLTKNAVLRVLAGGDR